MNAIDLVVIEPEVKEIELDVIELVLVSTLVGCGGICVD